MKKISDRERIEQIFKTADSAECDFLLYMAGVIYRSRFDLPVKQAKRGRPPKLKSAPPITSSAAAIGDKHQ